MGDFHQIDDYYYDDNFGTVFIQEEGRNDDFFQGSILPTDGITLRYSEIYNLEVCNINE